MVSGENKKLNILILSTSHPYKTAGIVAYDIFKGFKEAGHNPNMIVKIYDKYEEGIESIYSYWEYIFLRVVNKIKTHTIYRFTKYSTDYDHNYSVQDFDQTKEYFSTKRILNKVKVKPDFIFVIFAQNFLTTKNIFEIHKTTGAKVYWQLADMASFTGLCHYAWDCTGYVKYCGKCPAIYSNDENDISQRNLLFKLDNIRRTDLRVIIGSDWLKSRASQSNIFKNKKISKVFLSVDDSHFHPIHDHKSLRKKYGIPHSSFVISFGANDINDKRKGIDFILNAINSIKNEELSKEIFIIYSGDIRVNLELRFQSLNLGRLNRMNLIEFYHLSDLFISASLQDVGPYMLIEALMCGIPVVSFNTGFANDFVINGKTGFLVDNFDENKLKSGILNMINKTEGELVLMRNEAAERTRELISRSLQIKNYLELMEEDLNEKRK